jgi:hypothetical protein
VTAHSPSKGQYLGSIPSTINFFLNIKEFVFGYGFICHQAGLELAVFLLRSPECWDYSHMLAFLPSEFETARISCLNESEWEVLKCQQPIENQKFGETGNSISMETDSSVGHRGYERALVITNEER